MRAVRVSIACMDCRLGISELRHRLGDHFCFPHAVYACCSSMGCSTEIRQLVVSHRPGCMGNSWHDWGPVRRLTLRDKATLARGFFLRKALKRSSADRVELREVGVGIRYEEVGGGVRMLAQRKTPPLGRGWVVAGWFALLSLWRRRGVVRRPRGTTRR